MVIVTDLQRQILELREQGMSFRQIAKAIPCSDSSVHYALSERERQKSTVRGRNRRRSHSASLKAEYGAQCAVCGYDKCSEALEFDHIFPETKTRTISQLVQQPQKARDEAAKCLLLCCRCHRERHAGLLDIGAYLEPGE